MDISTITTITTPESFEQLYKFVKTYPASKKIKNSLIKAAATFSDYKYMYWVYKYRPELVDYKTFFKTSPMPFNHLGDAISVASNFAEYVEIITFYYNYDFNIIFDVNNNEVKTRIAFLESERAKNWRFFFIDPYDNRFAPCEYFAYKPISDETVYRSDTISVYNRPSAGKIVICNNSVAYARMREFSHGFLEIPPNKQFAAKYPNIKHLTEIPGIIIAGGSVAKVLDDRFDKKKVRSSDVDIFVYGPTTADREKSFNILLEWFDTDSTYFGIQNSVTSVYIKDVQRKFQLVSTCEKTPYTIINRFDLSHIQWIYGRIEPCNEPKFYGLPLAIESQITLGTKITNKQRAQDKRFIKALYYGFDIVRPFIDDINLDELINSERVKQIVKELHTWFYPQSQPDMDPEEERQHILAMIERDAKVSLVSSDREFVAQNIVINGNFESDYIMLDFKHFNIQTLRIPPIIRGANTRRQVKTATSAVKLSTPILTIAEKFEEEVNLDNMVGFKCYIGEGDPNNNNNISNNNSNNNNSNNISNNNISNQTQHNDFVQFIHFLESAVAKLYYNNRAVTKKLIASDSDPATICLYIQKHKIIRSARAKMAIVHDQRGNPLDIDVDITIGSKVQFIFTMFYNQTLEAERFLSLEIVRIVKFEPGTAPEDVNADLDISDTKSQLSITYDDEIKHCDFQQYQ